MIRKALLAAAALSLVAVSPWAMSDTGTEEPTVAPEYTQAIAKLVERPVVQKAFADLVAANAQNVKDLISLTEIPAPTFAESVRASYYADMLRAAGLESVEIDEAGNVLGMRKGTIGARTIALVAHLDTVFPAETDLTVKVDGDRYTAPGIGDDTRGLVTILSVLRAMQANDIQTRDNVLFVGSVGEEGLGDQNGVKHMLRDGGPGIDTLIAIDGGSAGRIHHIAVGAFRYRVTFRGPGGHSWGAFGYANPHHALARAITHFAETAPSITNEGDKTTFSVGLIGGGTSVNSIPFESWFDVDMRSANNAKLTEIEAVFQQAVALALQEENAARKDGPELTVEVKPLIDPRPAAVADPSSPLIQSTMAVMIALGITPELGTGSTDASPAIVRGIPAITLSRGGVSGDAHSLREWWENTDSHKALQVVLLTTLAQAGLVE